MLLGERSQGWKRRIIKSYPRFGQKVAQRRLLLICMCTTRCSRMLTRSWLNSTFNSRVATVANAAISKSSYPYEQSRITRPSQHRSWRMYANSEQFRFLVPDLGQTYGFIFHCMNIKSMIKESEPYKKEGFPY